MLRFPHVSSPVLQDVHSPASPAQVASPVMVVEKSFSLFPQRTACRITAGKPETISLLYEEDMDLVFRAVIESVEESVISSMLHAKAVEGRAGNRRESLADKLCVNK